MNLKQLKNFLNNSYWSYTNTEFKGGNNIQQKEKSNKIPLNLKQAIYLLKQYFSLH